MKKFELTPLLKMTIFLGLICFLGLRYVEKIIFIFQANPILNTLILGVFATGVFRLFDQINRLNPEKKWLEIFLNGGKHKSDVNPVLLAPVAEILKGHQGKSKPYLASTTLQSLLDMIGSRLSDDREMARYFVNVLILLGLLGTFIGLIDIVQSISTMINGLSVSVGNLQNVIQNLKTDLSSPLSGMATAFSSSLLGLSGSLILGYLTLQVSYEQNRFYTFIEERLSALTRISGDIIGVKKGEESIFSYLQALLEQTGDSLNRLELSLAKSEQHHQASAMRTLQMSEQLMKVSEKMYRDLGSMEKMATSYQTLLPLVEKLRDLSTNMGIDAETKGAIKSINTNLTSMTSQLSSDLKVLAKTVSFQGAKGKK